SNSSDQTSFQPAGASPRARRAEKRSGRSARRMQVFQTRLNPRSFPRHVIVGANEFFRELADRAPPRFHPAAPDPMAGGFSFDSLNKAQREAVASLDGPVLILAGAGTGKTRTVTCRISNMLERGIPPENILAVTFTNKAAAEMKERIGGMVSKKKAEAMTVCTFHSLCVRLLRGGIDKLGYKKNFSICSGSDQVGIMKQLIVRMGGADEKVKAEVVLS